ncbi:MAG TPA: Ig-like domain-containing protein [Candidatus Paceibacterota bacterium]|nr:Ig-like domain-containing protein [Candidatus Paceibacterota bacterium]
MKTTVRFLTASASVLCSLTLLLAARTYADWQPVAPYPLAGFQFDPVEAGNHIYIAGGTTAGPLADVYYVPVQSGGGLGTWTATTALPQADPGPGLAAHNGWVYAVLANGAVLRAPIQPTGGLGNWISEPVVDASTAYATVLKVYKNHLYLVGRYANGPRNTLRIAAINPDGSLAAWSAGSLPLALFRPAVQFYNDRVYLAGGLGQGGFVSEYVYSAPVQADGSVGAWRQEASLPVPLWYHSSVRIDDRILIFGGLTNTLAGSQSPAIYEAVLAPAGGAITTWALAGSVPNTFASGQGAVYVPANGNVYLAGGQGGPDSTNLTDQVWRNAFGPVPPTNAVPVAQAQTVALPKNTSTNLTLTASDADNDPLTFSIVSGPTNGVLVGTAPNVTYTPNADYVGQDAFLFKVNDGQADSAPALVAIEVLPVNRPPVALPQTVTVLVNSLKVVTLSGTDPDDDPLTFEVVAGPTNGVLAGTPPTLTYTPNPAYVGPDAFLFSVSDGALESEPALVTIRVEAEPGEPTAIIKFSPQTTFPGETGLFVIAPKTVAWVTLDGSDSSDPQNDPLEYEWTEGDTALGTNEVVTARFSLGSHTVTLTVKDASTEGTAEVSFKVISPLQAIALLAKSVRQSALPAQKKQPLMASLNAAAASLIKGHAIPAAGQLGAFQSKLRPLVNPHDAALAADWHLCAQQIINALCLPARPGR